MKNKPSINACRPGHGASCCLCCGSHNYDASPARIRDLFLRRSELMRGRNREYLLRSMAASRSPMTGSYYFDEWSVFDVTLPKRFDRGIQCPFIGFVDSGPETVGCLLYPGEQDSAIKYDCHRNYRSKIFTCAPKENLGYDEILFAARLMGDWFYYSLLLRNEPLLYELMKEGADHFIEDDRKKNDVKARLDAFLQKEGALINADPYFS